MGLLLRKKLHSQKSLHQRYQNTLDHTLWAVSQKMCNSAYVMELAGEGSVKNGKNCQKRPTIFP